MLLLITTYLIISLRAHYTVTVCGYIVHTVKHNHTDYALQCTLLDTFSFGRLRVVVNLRRRLDAYIVILLCLHPNADDVARPKTLRCVYIKKSCRACQLLWLPTPTDLIWMTGVAYLTIFGHTCCSVVGHSQSRLPVTFTGNAAMAKSGRGTSKQYVLDGAAAVSMVKWYDNKGALMASPLFGIEPEDECRRWSKKDKQHLEVKRPAVIERYNKYMGGVDLCDRMISYHKMGARTRRWNLRVISHFVDLALSNCWIEGRLDSREKMQLYYFRESVALVLINSVDESLSSSDSDTVQPAPPPHPPPPPPPPEVVYRPCQQLCLEL